MPGEEQEVNTPSPRRHPTFVGRPLPVAACPEASLSATVESGVRVAIRAPTGRITGPLRRRVPSGPRLWGEPVDPCRAV